MERDYTFLESTTSLCGVCLNRIEGKIIRRGNSVFLLKSCPKHGEQTEILEEDAEYHISKQLYEKPGNCIFPENKLKKGCPFDCGLCDQHEQHTCNALIEVTGKCDLMCPTCYASSGKGENLSLKTIEKMMDYFQKAEGGNAEILQISGGEPTVHPDIIRIVELSKKKNFRYVMLNTNGVRIARDEEFVRQLSQFRGRFEIYLQFDGFKSETYQYLRGNKDLLKTKLKAIEKLRQYKIPITLVCTLENGLNDDEIGKIFEFAMNTPGVRGINFQPVAYFGRVQKKNNTRLTLSGVIKRLVEQTKGAVRKNDIVPLPCDACRVAVSFFRRDKSGFIPLTRYLKVRSYLPLIDNTFAFDAEKIIKEGKKNFSIGSCCSLSFLNSLRSIVPKEYSKLSDEDKRRWWDEHSFRVSIVSFVDRFNFDAKSMKKECVHIITPDLKRIPFSAYNLVYRK